MNFVLKQGENGVESIYCKTVEHYLDDLIININYDILFIDKLRLVIIGKYYIYFDTIEAYMEIKKEILNNKGMK